MSIITAIIIAVLILNSLAAVFTVLRSVRDISTTWAWLLVLLFLPVIGFVLYLFAGRGLSAKRVRAIQAEYQHGIGAFVRLQQQQNNRNRLLPDTAAPAAKELTAMFLNSDQAPVLTNAAVTVFTEGPAKFAQLFADIDAATDYVYLEYYTIYNDTLGNELQRHLVAKAESGVPVYVLYDAWGSMGAGPKWWQPLIAAGGHAESYFSSRHLVLDFRLNYRNHRKLVAIDDRIGYIGGFNVGDQYVSRKAKFGHWRDTHLRVVGGTVLALKVRFIMDWNATVAASAALTYAQTRPTPTALQAQNAMQIVASGPDSNAQQIKAGFVKLITGAVRSVWLQSPYLVPDDTVQDALITAALAGIDVRVMIPDMPDHPFIYRASQYYASRLSAAGVKVYQYTNGFLHAKTMVVDDVLASVGSANCDIRSFKLNFEINAFIYDPNLAHQLGQIFLADQADSDLLTPAAIAAQGRWLRFKQRFSRLLSPIL